MYSLIIGSKLTQAKEFKKWITGTVLPSIRKTGKYDVKEDANKNKIPKIMYDLNDYINKSCIYILRVSNDEYKFGITDNIEKRMSDHKRCIQYEEIVKIYVVNNTKISRNVEDKIKKMLRQFNIAIKRGNMTEFFKTTDIYTIDYITSFFDKYINDEIDDNSTNEFNFQKYKFDKQLEFEKYKFDKQIEIDKLKLSLEHKHKYNLINIDNSIIHQMDNENNTQPNQISVHINEQNNEQSKDQSDEKNKEKLSHVDKDYNKSTIKLNKKGKPSKYPDRDIGPRNKCTTCGYFCSSDGNCKMCSKFEKYKDVKFTAEKPSYEQLKIDIETMPYTIIGKKYGVSDNSIRKWLRKYEKHIEIK